MVVIVSFFNLAQTVAKYGIPAWAVVKVAEALAGQETIAQFMVAFFDNTGDGPWEFLAYTVLIVWGIVERYLRHHKTAYFQARIKRLEERIDLGRTSSGLRETGQTNPRDL
jgi:hypothetical protein